MSRWSRYPPGLHSFPTRRSSDLDGAARGLPQGDAAHAARLAVSPADPVLHRHPGRVSGARRRGARSEEHTSELQSRPQLVCRLLLEKKTEKWMKLVSPVNNSALR